MNRIVTSAMALAGLAMLLAAPRSVACSRVVYPGDSALYIVGRSLDWKTPIPTNLYVYPSGITKKSHDLPGAFSWTSKYGAVYAVSYDGGITEGMNEKGLVVNGLFCKGTVYNNERTEKNPPMSLAVFVAWMLDLNETTDQVVKMIRSTSFSISGATFDGGTVSALHWGITDRFGKTAILEFNHGKIDIYEGDSLYVLTNDPPYPQMTAINDYWKKIGGADMLPGTVKSPDRFVRASFFDNNVEHTGEAALGTSITRSILMNVSVPFHYTVDGDPNVSSTQWRTYANLRDRLYYFDSVTALGVYYIDLKKCNLSKGAPIMKIDNTKMADAVGEANSRLRVSPPFKPMY